MVPSIRIAPSTASGDAATPTGSAPFTVAPDCGSVIAAVGAVVSVAVTGEEVGVGEASGVDVGFGVGLETEATGVGVGFGVGLETVTGVTTCVGAGPFAACAALRASKSTPTS